MTTASLPTKEAAEPFESVAALRLEHRELLRRWLAQDRKPETILRFLDRAQLTGERIDAAADREAAQGILDYWTATLVSVTERQMTPPGPRVLAAFDPTKSPDLSNIETPFMGLNPFREKDSDRFFGRDEATKSLVEKLLHQAAVIVVGPSGSGKSSLVLAGLLACLKRQSPSETSIRVILPVVMPGSDPFAALLGAMRPENVDPQTWRTQHQAGMQRSADGLRHLVDLTYPGVGVLLVVDQFEEVFTLCDDQAVREQFAAALAGLCASGSPHRLVITLREDFLGDARQLAGLRDLASDPEARFSPPPLSSRELRLVIERPAELVGLHFEDGIVDDLVKEVVGEPAALPLLQFTLRRLWDNRDRNRITWQVYRKVGSPREALKRTADQVYEDLKIPENQQAAERIFVELVQPTLGGEYVRRRVRRESLRRLLASDRIDRVLDRFVEAGLIRRIPGLEADDDRFEVVHEALVRNWPRLDEWLCNHRERRIKQFQFETTARLWAQSGRKRGYLLSGEALAEARQYTGTAPELQELIAESESTELKGRWKLAVLILVVGLIGSLAVLGVTIKARDDANRARDEANRDRDRAQHAQADMSKALVAEKEARAAEREAKLQAGAVRLSAAQAIGAIASKTDRTQKGPIPVSIAIQRILTDSSALTRRLWTSGKTIRVRFLDGTEALRRKVQQYAPEWTKYANLDFRFGSRDTDAEIRISFNAPVSWSFTGTTAGQIPDTAASMTLGTLQRVTSERVIRRTILHEFGHALGLVHATQVPGAHIPWDTTAVNAFFAGRYGYTPVLISQNVLRSYDPSLGYSGIFDPYSIMNIYEFPSILTHGRFAVQFSDTLSDGDKELISSLYRGRWTPPGGKIGLPRPPTSR